MRITKNQLRRIIREGIKASLKEGYHFGESDSWEVSVNVDYNKDPVVTWNIAAKTSSGADSVLSGDSERLKLKSLYSGIEKVIADRGLDSDEADDLKKAYYKAEDSFESER